MKRLINEYIDYYYINSTKLSDIRPRDYNFLSNLLIFWACPINYRKYTYRKQTGGVTFQTGVFADWLYCSERSITLLGSYL